MATIISSSGGIKQEHEIPTEPGKIMVILHQQGIRVDAPEFVEINPHHTVDCIQKLNQGQWEFISQGDPFRILFYLGTHVQNYNGIAPSSVNELKSGDMGIQHVAGCIILGCEAMFMGKSVFFRNPETYLHPATEQIIMRMFNAMIRICGRSGTVTKEGQNPDEWTDKYICKEVAEAKKALGIVDREITEAEITIKWLEAKKQISGPDHKMARVGNTTYTVTQLIDEVRNNTAIGKQLIAQYLKSYTPS